jgi:type IV secretory pathway TrbF-like protein
LEITGRANGCVGEVLANERSYLFNRPHTFCGVVVSKMKMKTKWFLKRNGNAESNGNSHPLFTANPYLNARREWNSQIERTFASIHVWQLVALASLLVALASVAGLTYLGGKSKYLPYLMEVDKRGEIVVVWPQATGPADPRVIRASLASFIVSARLVTPDQDYRNGPKQQNKKE